VGIKKSYLEGHVQKMRADLFRNSAILLVVAVILAALLMTVLLRPLGALRTGLEQIGRGNLDSPIRVADPTELGVLANTVNKMARQLKASYELTRAHEREIVETQKEIIHTLGDVVENRSSETANHTLRVADMSYHLAKLVGLADEEANLLRMAAPMHDVGKIGIPDSILNKPGKLTPEEYEVIKTHSEIGHGILAKSNRPILQAAAIVAHEHHERWDGTGYPRGLKGEAIHIFGRIVSLVDVFDAVYSDRVYRPAMKLEQALEIITEGRGTQFEPLLVDVFLAHFGRFLAVLEKYKDNRKVVTVPLSENPTLAQETRRVELLLS
jgi:putative two-component system response regulator